MSAPLLDLINLRVAYRSERGLVDAVRGISFALGAEKLGIVGESGSGKSTVGRALLRLLPRNANVTADRMALEDEDLLLKSESDMRAVRGARMSMILQDPRFSLNPVMTVGEQIAETCRLHRRLSAGEARQRTLEMLAAVHIAHPERVFGLYPHEVSGGMGQRIMIAMMLAPEPKVIIADEPTSALDVTVRASVLAILDDLVRSRGMGLLFISHDLGLVSSFCDRLLVMYRGEIVEALDAAELDRARHPYTRALLDAAPRLDRPRDRLPVMDRALIDAARRAS